MNVRKAMESYMAWHDEYNPVCLALSLLYIIQNISLPEDRPII